jgi:alpha-glucosidase
MVLLLTMRGTPTLYYGDELGMLDVPIPEALQQDPYGKRVPGLGLGRDPERTPMQWDDSPRAGFTEPDVAPWLPLAADADRRNVAAQREDPASMLVLTQRLLAARRTHAALHRGTYRPYDEVPDGVFGFFREHRTERLLVLVSFRPAAAEVTVPEGVTSVVISTHPSPSLPERGSTLALRPDEALVLKLAG